MGDVRLALHSLRAFTATVTIATGVLFGTAPAFRAGHSAPMEALKDSGRGTSGHARGSLASSLVVAQVALSLVVAAGLFVRTFERLASVPLGFDSERLLVVNVDTKRAHVDPAGRLAFFDRLVGAIAAVPGVSHAAGSMSTPASGGRMTVEVTGPPTMSERRVLMNAVTPGWFAAYGMAIRAGRDVDPRDTANGPPVAVVNEAFARRFFPGRNAIGETVAARTIVGVAGDQVIQGGYNPNGVARSRRDSAPPTIYMPLAQSAGSGPPDRTNVIITVRSAVGSPAALERNVAGALAAVDRDLAFTFRPLPDQLNASLAQERLVAMLSGFFGALALLLAGLGLYGLTSYAVSRRRTEIGIRMALGAAPGRVVRLVLSRVAFLVGAGILAGAAASIWLSRFAAPLLYGLQPGDPATLAGAALMLAAVGAVAGWLPAWRASQIDPAGVLRES